jgi:hypothetical protein
VTSPTSSRSCAHPVPFSWPASFGILVQTATGSAGRVVAWWGVARYRRVFPGTPRTCLAQLPAPHPGWSPAPTWSLAPTRPPAPDLQLLTSSSKPAAPDLQLLPDFQLPDLQLLPGLRLSRDLLFQTLPGSWSADLQGWAKLLLLPAISRQLWAAW